MISVKNLCLVIEYILCLPGTSAPVERVFSVMNAIWADDRGKMLESTVKGLLIVKINVQLSCLDFFNNIKENKPFLRKVLGSDKYVS